MSMTSAAVKLALNLILQLMNRIVTCLISVKYSIGSSAVTPRSKGAIMNFFKSLSMRSLKHMFTDGLTEKTQEQKMSYVITSNVEKIHSVKIAVLQYLLKGFPHFQRPLAILNQFL